MTVINPSSISGITSITMPSGDGNVLTIHTSDASNTERFRIDSTGTTKIVTGIVTTLTATTGIVTTFEATTGNITTLRTPTGISTHFTADKISLPDSSDGSLCIGIGSDFKINHNGGHSYITEVGGGDLYIQGSDIILRDAGTLEKHIEMTQNGSVDLYNNGTKRFETTSNGVRITGQSYISEGTINLEKATVHHHRILSNDTGNDLAFQQSSDTGSNTNFTTYLRIKDGGDISLPVDSKKLLIGAGDDLQLYHDGSSSYLSNTTGNLYFEAKAGETAIQIIPDGAVDLRHNGIKKIETALEGVVIPSGGGNCLRVFGQNTARPTSALIIGQNNTTTSQLRAYGPDGSTNGRIEFRSSRSDATNTINLIYDSGNLEFASGCGLDFHPQGASSENLLNDYEIGTWSPSGSWTTITASYTKIGRMVYAGFSLRANASSGNVTIGNLPFTSGSTHGQVGGITWGLCEFNTTDSWLNGSVDDDSTTATVRRGNATIVTFGSGNNNMNQNAFIRGMIIYMTA